LAQFTRSFYLSEFYSEFDFPLAFGVERSVPNREGGTISLRLSCRHPLTLVSLQVKLGTRWSSRAPALPIDEKYNAGEWSFGQVTIPHREGQVWFKFAELAKPLRYELVVPTVEDQVAEVVRALYGKGSVEQGSTRWQEDLFTATGGAFEVALLNAIARCGLPVLFAGRLSDGGPQTPGYDLVVVDHVHLRLAAISAKGEKGGNPSNETYKNLDTQLQILRSVLPEWEITGIVAMHTPNAILGPSKQRTYMLVWGREDVEELYRADTRAQVEALLWPLSPLLLCICGGDEPKHAAAIRREQFGRDPSLHYFRDGIVKQFPQAERIVTPFNDSIAKCIEEYQNFLRSLGYAPVAEAAFGKLSRGFLYRFAGIVKNCQIQREMSGLRCKTRGFSQNEKHSVLGQGDENS